MAGGRMQATRYEGNPIISPRPECWWEAKGTLNPAAIQDAQGRIHLLYRAVGFDGISRFGYASTYDGVTIDQRPELPVYEGDIDDPSIRLGVEDPRITGLEGRFYITYTQTSLYAANAPFKIPNEQAPWRVRAGMLVTDDFTHFESLGHIMPDVDTKDCVLFPERIGGRYVLLHRIYPDIQIAYSDDLRHWEGHQALMRTRPGSWESERIGAGGPPLKTELGWLLFYHANEFFQSEGNRKRYRIGMAMLDLEHPDRVFYRHPEPLLEPETPYERTGAVNDVVFVSGAVEKDGLYYLYYGGADGVSAVATIAKDEVLGLVSSASISN
jgi:beta-1,2-mannobiose phosphorylase / 1,2-beta-oligomannan phosphorylase